MIKSELIRSKRNELICTENVNHGIARFYPKSLKGIENNNGWTKIYGAEDLPKEGNLFLECLCNEKQATHHFLLGDENYMIKNYTHFKIIHFSKPIF